MARTKGRVTREYQNRLVQLVDQCRHREGKEISLNQLGRELGNQSLASRFSLWRTNELKRPVTDENFELLSKVDPKGRSPEQLKQWVEEGNKVNDIEIVEPIEIVQLNEPLEAIRLWINLSSGGRPVHQMVEQVLARHGYALNDEGIDFFILHTSAVREQRKVLIQRYLKGQDVAADAMVATYPCIATAINELIDLPISINGHDLEWLDFSSNSKQHIGSKAQIECK